ncbi:MAG: hypothetical protein HY822_11265 [Acidobacteria bacterium]|nr:hypothetical protein [Acidobacteriota bacterium]
MTRFAPLAFVPLLAGCGYVGDPMPPALKTPVAVADLKAWQRGSRIVVEFTAPGRTTEGFLIGRVGEIDLRAGLSPGPVFNLDGWAAAARRIAATAEKPGPVRVETPAAEWVGRETVIGVRTANVNGRFSGWSNLATLTVLEPLARPAALAAEAVPEGVRLRWTAPERAGQEFRIWRRAGAQEQSVLAARIAALEWIDTAAEYGASYEYSVQTVTKAGPAEAESEPSETVAIVPRDTFPPAVPRDLTAVAGAGSVELGWERSTEPDFAGYRVYRALNGGAYERIADRVEAPSFSDRGVQPGAKYGYAVSAVDQAGNESARSAVVEIESR